MPVARARRGGIATRPADGSTRMDSSPSCPPPMTMPATTPFPSRQTVLLVSPLLGVVLLLAGCASSPTGAGGARSCADAGLAWAVGQPADEPTMRRLLADSGAGLINPIGPDSIVRGDSRSDRLRVYIDPDNVIERVACE